MQHMQVHADSRMCMQAHACIEAWVSGRLGEMHELVSEYSSMSSEEIESELGGLHFRCQDCDYALKIEHAAAVSWETGMPAHTVWHMICSMHAHTHCVQHTVHIMLHATRMRAHARMHALRDASVLPTGERPGWDELTADTFVKMCDQIRAFHRARPEDREPMLARDKLPRDVSAWLNHKYAGRIAYNADSEDDSDDEHVDSSSD